MAYSGIYLFLNRQCNSNVSSICSQPGRWTIYLDRDSDKNKLEIDINEWYTERIWIPIINEYLYDLYGEDIAQIIMFYYNNISVESVVDLVINA